MTREWIARQLCRIGICLECAPHSTPEGIGGKCINCGKMHGWVTRAELQNYARRQEFLQKGISK